MDDWAKVYSTLTDQQLLALIRAPETLRHEARDALEAEIRKRELDVGDEVSSSQEEESAPPESSPSSARFGISVMLRAGLSLIAGPFLATGPLTFAYFTKSYTPSFVTLVVSFLFAGAAAGYGASVIAGRLELLWAFVVGLLMSWMTFDDAPGMIGVTAGQLSRSFVLALAILLFLASLVGGYLRSLQLGTRRRLQPGEKSETDYWTAWIGGVVCLLALPAGSIMGAATGNTFAGLAIFPLLGLGLLLYFGARSTAKIPLDQVLGGENVPAGRTRCDACGVEYPSHEYLKPAGSRGFICKRCGESR